MKQFETYEIAIKGENITSNWADVRPVCKVSGAENKTIYGFYAGDGNYVVRFLPRCIGKYHFHIDGVVNGDFDEVSEASSNHGMVRAVKTHFEYDDGTLYFPFGTTVYALMHQDEEIEKKTLDSLRRGCFNKIRLCVFPKHYDYNENEPRFYPFEKDENGKWDVTRPNFDFYDHFEKVLKEIFSMGIQVDLILFHPYDRWGFRELGKKNNRIYLDYLLRRFSAYPNLWWSLANEYDLTLDTIPLREWHALERYVANHDPYHHLLSNHQCFAAYDYKRKNITHICTQTKVLAQIPMLIKKYGKPCIVDECCYEGNIPNFWGSISAEEMTFRFYRMIASGAYCTHGETYLSDDNVLWWSRGGELKGESPERIKYLKDIVESFSSLLVPYTTPFSVYNHLNKPSLTFKIGQYFAPKHVKKYVMGIALAKKQELRELAFAEYEWNAKSEDDKYFFTFLDRRTCAETTMFLPEEKKYKVELIDAWNQTRTTLKESASGVTKLELPGKEGFAILATQIQKKS